MAWLYQSSCGAALPALLCSTPSCSALPCTPGHSSQCAPLTPGEVLEGAVICCVSEVGRQNDLDRFVLMRELGLFKTYVDFIFQNKSSGKGN